MTVKQISAVCLGLFSILLLTDWHPVYGQTSGELLQNPGFSSYYGIGGANVVPIGWRLTSNIPVGTSSHTYIYDGPVEYPGQPRTGQAWALSANSARFTAIGYQHVAGVAAGTKVHFSVYGNVYTCNKSDSCIENGVPYRISDRSSGAVERVGIDPDGGTDPYAATIQWSPFLAPFDLFQQMNVMATATSANGVTVFLYATQSTAMLLNDAYWYGASLTAVGSSPPPRVPTATNATPGAAPSAVVVKTQVAQPDGSIVHTVMAGETLYAIALAYKISIIQIEQLNNISAESLLRIGQKLIIKPGPTAIPSATVAAATAGPATRSVITLQPGPGSIMPTAGQNETAAGSGSSANGGPLSADRTSGSPGLLLIDLTVVGIITLFVYVGAVMWGLIVVRWRQGVAGAVTASPSRERRWPERACGRF